MMHFQKNFRFYLNKKKTQNASNKIFLSTSEKIK